MSRASKKPDFETLTHQVRSKKRFAPIADRALLDLMKASGQRLVAAPRLAAEGGGALVGIYALPTNNVVEIYIAPDGSEVGYLFCNLDVWMTFGSGVEYQ